MKSIIITGASSGIGKSAALLFLEKGWRVIATARNTGNVTGFPASDNLHILPLDVTRNESVERFMASVAALGGSVDVLVNNAGYSVTGSFEDAGEERDKRQFEVNVFGLMRLTRALLPVFRNQGSGTIINIASVAGHIGMPAFSLYNSSKFAVEGFSEALWYEVRPFGIKVKLVEPGPIKTDFYGRSMDVILPENSPYYPVLGPSMKQIDSMGNKGLPPERVAKTIYRAAVSGNFRLRYPVGIASVMIFARHATPHTLFRFILRKFMGTNKQFFEGV